MDRPQFLADLRQDSNTYLAVATLLEESNPLGDYGVMQRGLAGRPMTAGGSFLNVQQLEGWTPLLPKVSA